MKYSLYDIYPSGIFNGYGIDYAKKRFAVLKEIPHFNSILDVGSGPCFLKQWIEENFTHNIEYEAVDIRQDALDLCDCPKYNTIPSNKTYDLACLFGTVTYNIDFETNKNKQLLKDLLIQSKTVSKQILFTVFKDDQLNTISEKRKSQFVFYTKNEIKEMLDELGLKIKNIEKTFRRNVETDVYEYDPWYLSFEYDRFEYFILCESK